MTFKEWLAEYLPDYESEYSGNIKAMEAAWNGAILSAATTTADASTFYMTVFQCVSVLDSVGKLISTEFGSNIETAE